jgi:hypothetical protein
MRFEEVVILLLPRSLHYSHRSIHFTPYRHFISRVVLGPGLQALPAKPGSELGSNEDSKRFEYRHPRVSLKSFDTCSLPEEL